MFITEEAIIAVNRFIPNQNPLLFIADDVFSKVSPLRPENCFKDSSASDFISSITSSNVILPIKLLSSSITGADIKSSFSNILITWFELSFALRGFFSTIIFLIISPGGFVIRFEIGKTPLNLLFLLTTNKLSVDNGISFLILRYRKTSSTE